MAVTSIWYINGRVDHAIHYACNPEKTSDDARKEIATQHKVGDVVEYTADQLKTEQRTWVSCVNCTEENAIQDFMATKRKWGKLDGRICYHGYQSFKENEVTAEQAHRIGVTLAQELWGDRFEVVVATHCNTGHYHNHFVVNSVSFFDGNKYRRTPEDYRRMREISDRLCREERISVIENPQGRKKSYPEWEAEQNGKPTKRGMVRADIDRAIQSATTERHFIQTLTDMGYEIHTRTETGKPLKYPSIKPHGAKKPFRFHNLGSGYSLEEIKDRIYENMRRKVPFPEAERDEANRKRRQKGFVPYTKPQGLRALYIHYHFELGIISQHPASVKRVSFLMREDVIKLDKFDAQVRLLNREQIDTADQLASYQGKTEARMEALSDRRADLRNALKRAKRSGEVTTAESISIQIDAISKEIAVLRKEVKLCTDIMERSEQVALNLDEHMAEQEIERKENEHNEHFSRSSRSDRAYDA